MALKPKSVYISRAVSHFYETEFEIWDSFGPPGSTQISTWVVKYATFEGIFFKNIAASELKSCIKPSILKRED